MQELVWEDPPEQALTHSQQVMINLKQRPMVWAKIDSGTFTLLPWWSRIARTEGFEVKTVLVTSDIFGPRNVYARYIG